MKYLLLLFGIGFCPLLFAQSAQSCAQTERNGVPSTESKAQLYYQNIIDRKGPNHRYIAAEKTLALYANTKDEYCSKLYNLLAEEAVLIQDYEPARCYYAKVLTTDFDKGYYTEGLLAEQEKIKAIVGLRNIALQEKAYEQAIDYHHQYRAALANGWPDQLRANQLQDDKILAICYQRMGKSEKAIQLLAPYAFGIPSVQYSQIDKQVIDYLTDLLRTKYPKRAYRKMLTNVYHQVYVESTDDGIVCYLQIFDNKIYFQPDGAAYHERVANNASLRGQAVAHYQRKLINSYFYQSLVK